MNVVMSHAICPEGMEQLLRSADIVSVHMPLVDATRGMIRRRELSMMRRSAVLVNCARGAVVDERDLAQALRDGMIAGAGIDVFCSEPPAADDPLLHCPNVVLSPHAAALTREATIRVAVLCVGGCLAVCRGEKWPYVVDRAVYDHPRWADRPWAEIRQP